MVLQENGSIERVNENKELIIEMEKMLRKVELPLVSSCCIYKVPQKIRKLNEEAYTPSIVSIGPFHYGDKRLESMEDLKLRYLKSFLERTKKGLGDCIGYITRYEEVIRSCYSETIKQSSHEFVRIILTDACFIIEYFLRCLEWPQEDPLLSKPWLRCDVKLDLILLENQLPWFVLDELFNLAEPSYDCNGQNVTSFFYVAYRYFTIHFLQSILPGVDSSKFSFDYFYEHYQQYIMMPDGVGMQLNNLTDLLRIFYLPPNRLPKREKERVKHLYSASQLVEAGVKFHVGQDNRALELQFAKGVLTIPRIEVCHWTEILIRNVVAFEQCHYPFQTYITDYIILLDFLIDTTKDVDILVDKGIMVNTLGDSSAVANMVNNLCLNVVQENINGDYVKLCKKLNCFYEDRFHKYKAIFIHDYFSTPWKITSFIAAVVLLLLTLIQATCSIISLFRGIG